MPDLPAFGDADRLFEFLAGQRNDLEAPASTLAPAVGEALAALAAQAGCRLTRMSGSGSTCFGLFAAEGPALAAAEAVRRGQPEWWVAAAPVKNVDET
jgi:4-diphosphocytidyl-2-C-methyl-D-erythritol kinase